MQFLKHIKFLLIMLLFQACGVNLSNVSYGIINGYPFPIDEEFLPIIKEFEEMSGNEITTSVVFSDDFSGENDAGYCLNTQLGIKGIRIKNKYKKADYDTLKFIVFHELGHCELNRKHDYDLVLLKSNILKDKDNKELGRYYKPKSVMWPTATFIPYFTKKPEAYSNELVHREFIDDSLLEVKSFKSEKEASKNLIVIGLRGQGITDEESPSEILHYNCEENEEEN